MTEPAAEKAPATSTGNPYHEDKYVWQPGQLEFVRSGKEETEALLKKQRVGQEAQEAVQEAQTEATAPNSQPVASPESEQ